MTNGEKMRADFPDIEMWGESKDTLDYSLGGMIHRVTKRWWNAEYKESRKGQWLRMEDAISRQEVLEQTYLWSKDEFLRVTNPFDYLRKRINSLPPVNPQPKTEVLDKIRAEIEEHVEINQALNVDRARALCWCLDVIDKYKAESECEDKEYADCIDAFKEYALGRK